MTDKEIDKLIDDVYYSDICGFTAELTDTNDSNEIKKSIKEIVIKVKSSLGDVSGSNYDKFGEKIMLADPLIGSVNECGICKYKSNSDRKEPCSPCKLDTGEYYR